MATSIILILAFWLTVFRAYVLSKLWFWFVTPIFDLPPIGWAPAYGLALFLTFAISKPLYVPEDRDKTTEGVTAFIHPFVVFLLGWIVQTFFM